MLLVQTSNVIFRKEAILDVQTAFYISCDSDVAVHTALDCIATPATML